MQYEELEVVLGTTAAIVGTAAVIAGVAWMLAMWHRKLEVRRMHASRMTFGAIGEPQFTRCKCGAVFEDVKRIITCVCGRVF